MKRISALALLIVASLASATGAFCQEGRLKANIPFDFTVGNTWMPAGEYTISSPAHLVIQFSKRDGKAFAMVTSSPRYDRASGGNKLVFSKYGDRYFLKEIDSPATTAMNVEVSPGKAERRARTLEANLQGVEETLVAAE